MARCALPLTLLLILAGPRTWAQEAAAPGDAAASFNAPTSQEAEPSKAEGPQTSVTVGLIRSVLFTAILGHPWLELSVERRIKDAMSVGLLTGVSGWNDPKSPVLKLLELDGLGGERQYIGAYGRLNMIGNFSRNLHLSGELELERMKTNQRDEPFYGIVGGLLIGGKTSSKTGGVTTEFQAGLRLSLAADRPILGLFWPVMNFRMGYSF